MELFFEDFNDFGEPDLVSAREAAIQFVVDMSGGTVAPYWLTFLGNSGNGKTMLAKRISKWFRMKLRDLYDERFDGITEIRYRRGGFKSWEMVCDDMLNGDYSGIRDLSDDWFVCLDDIGTENARIRDLSISKLFQLFNRRLGLFTVVTANIDLEGINKRMDTRIASRLVRDGNIAIDVKAIDYALRN